MPFGTTGQDGRRIAAFLASCLAVAAACLLLSTPADAATRVKVLGRAVEGQTLSLAPRTATKGSRFTWWRCRPATRCTRIPRATGSRFRVRPADIGFRLRLDVRSGRRVTRSRLTAVVRPRPPVLVAAPIVVGDAAVGQTLGAGAGSWSAGGRTVTRRFQWLACTSSCTPIAGATGSSYSPSVLDIGVSLRVRVAATVRVRGVTATSRAESASSAPVRLDLTNTGAPSISGAAIEGATLTASSGTWQASGVPVATSIRWVRCAGTCVAVGEGASYRLVAADVGATLRVDVTAAAASVVGGASSASTAVVVAVVPNSTSAPGIVAPSPLLVGSIVAADLGSWSTLEPTTMARQWQRCTLASCVDIAGANGPTYVPTVADLDMTLRMRVTATHLGITAAAASTQTVAVRGIPPTALSVPRITGSATEGLTLAATAATWTGTGAITTTLRWWRCNPSACSRIMDASGTSYVLRAADVGHTIHVVSGAVSPWGSASVQSSSTSVIVEGRPANVAPPVVSSPMLRDTRTATTSTGTWSGLTPMTYTYAWQRCPVTGASCTTIAGATGPTYTMVTQDVGSTLRSVVTASNGFGSRVQTSAPSAVVDVSPLPVNVLLPSVEGPVVDSYTLRAMEGTWSGLSITTRGYQWRRCSPALTVCSNISGATGTTYRLTSADVGFRIRVRETVTNAVGNASIESIPGDVVSPVAPTNVSVPTIIGLARDGQVLQSGIGSWTGTPALAYAYEWLRCDIAGTNCEPIDRATSQNYNARTDDVGSRIRVRVTASNEAGTATAVSAPTGTVVAAPPVNVALPTLTGTAAVNAELAVTEGTWSGYAPISIGYAWFRCSSTTVCDSAPIATGAQYTLTDADVGKRIRARVTATNVAGSASASVFSEAVAAAPVAPSVVSPPTITGTAKQGLSLTATQATFAGTATIAHELRWERCDVFLERCATIPGAYGTSYRLVEVDVDSVIRVVDTGSNVAGYDEATSAPSAVVTATVPPTLLASDPPTIDAPLWEHGQLVTLDPGTWFGTPTITLAYQWQRCELDGNDCVEIAAATGIRYELRAEDVAHRIRARVRATSPYGSTDGYSALSSELAAARPPVNSGALPSITGTVEQTKTLTASNGGWSGSPIDRYAYQWLRCSMIGTNCEELFGATSRTYRLGAGDVGHTVRVRVTAFNAATTTGVSATSAETSVVIAALPPVEQSPPQVAMGLDLNLVSIVPGSWSGTETISVKWQWQHCTSVDPASCTDWGAPTTDPGYRFQDGDIGFYMRVIELASNPVATNVRSTPTDIFGPIATSNQFFLLSIDPPTITGEPEESLELVGDVGTWFGVGPIAYEMTWQRCDVAGENCRTIDGATWVGEELQDTYEPTIADVGSRLRIKVVASNALGVSEPAYSEPTAIVTAGRAPVNVLLPQVSGKDGVVGTRLTSTSLGTWEGTPDISTARTWRRCSIDAPDTCQAIAGATSLFYTITNADVGFVVRMAVTATNAFGSTVAMSAPITVVPAVAPVIAPTITNATVGTREPLVAGHVLRVSTNTSAGTQPIAYTYEWNRCDAGGTACTAITGVTSQSYATTMADLGSTIRAIVTATNAAEQPTTATTSPTGTVGMPVAPGNVELPTVPDLLERTAKATSTNGTWLGSGPIAYTRIWQRCDSRVASTCEDITGANDLAYTPNDLDVGSFLRVLVTATNGLGSDGAVSVASEISLNAVTAGRLPTALVAPRVTGTLTVGSTLTAESGSWGGTGTITFSYQWQRCAADGTGCVDIAGRSASTYTTVDADRGFAVRVRVHGHNLVGVSEWVDSPAVGPIA